MNSYVLIDTKFDRVRLTSLGLATLLDSGQRIGVAPSETMSAATWERVKQSDAELIIERLLNGLSFDGSPKSGPDGRRRRRMRR
jgi:hypothetical protein